MISLIFVTIFMRCYSKTINRQSINGYLCVYKHFKQQLGG